MLYGGFEVRGEERSAKDLARCGFDLARFGSDPALGTWLSPNPSLRSRVLLDLLILAPSEGFSFSPPCVEYGVLLRSSIVGLATDSLCRLNFSGIGLLAGGGSLGGGGGGFPDLRCEK